MTFSVVEEFDRTRELILELHQIGVDNPRFAENACCPYPHPSTGDIARMLGGEHSVLLFYDDEDEVLAGAVSFVQSTGGIAQLINKYFLTPDGKFSEKGNELVRTMAQAIKERSDSGRAVSRSPNPNGRDVSKLLGLEFDE